MMKENMTTVGNREQYDAVIIGFGKGGKTMAGALAAAGKRTALVEQSADMYGGTCINVGCIPTKALVHNARMAAASGDSFEKRAESYRAAVARKDGLTGMLRAKNYHKLADHPLITVIDGRASFLSPHQIQVEGKDGSRVLEGEFIFINTGSVPVVPPIEGIQGNPYVYFSETMLALEELPKRLVIVGGGYIGVEFASIYADFGSQVTILQDGDRFLPREDEEIADEVRNNLKKRGAEVVTGVKVLAVNQKNGCGEVKVSRGEEEILYPAEAVLIATGRKPNTKDLNLTAAGVEMTSRGAVVTDDSLRTTAGHIFAMGDVRGSLQFTYISLDDFRIVRSAVLGDGSYTLKERGAVPYSVFLNPPFSRVGMSETEAVNAGCEVQVKKLAAAAIPKAQVTGQPSGLLKAVIDAKTGKILGAHLFCEESHEMVNLVKLAMDAGLPYGVLRDMIYTHPTMSESFNDLFS